jgi:hypothetical protein|tara:strand:+ start:2186 stop:3115 length:930 start_codon:yes stop_codon:yes gene_type:complete
MIKNMKMDVLIDNINKSDLMFNLDLVLEGGCMNGAYEIGGLMFIKQMERREFFKIERISGASVGAYAGFLYLIDELDIYIEKYEDMREGFRETLALHTLKVQLETLMKNLSNEQFKSLQNDKLFITFFDINQMTQIIKSKYTDKQDMIDTILKSCHIPFLIDGNLFFKQGDKSYMDGGIPFIFNDIKKSERKKILYMSLTNNKKLRGMLNVSREKTIHGRVLEGIIGTYNFFLTMLPTDMCSYVDEWSFKDKITHQLFFITYKILVYSIIFIYSIFKIIFPYIKDNDIFISSKPMLKKIYKKILMYLVF